MKIQCTESATHSSELTSLPMQNLSTTILSFRQSPFNNFFIHRNAKTTGTCPHPFLLEKNLAASFSVGEEKKSCVKYRRVCRHSFHPHPPISLTDKLHKAHPKTRHRGAACTPRVRTAGLGARSSQAAPTAESQPEFSPAWPRSPSHVCSTSN